MKPDTTWPSKMSAGGPGGLNGVKEKGAASLQGSLAGWTVEKKVCSPPQISRMEVYMRVWPCTLCGWPRGEVSKACREKMGEGTTVRRVVRERGHKGDFKGGWIGKLRSQRTMVDFAF